MANLQYLDEQLGIPEEEEEGLLGKALRSIDAPRQYLLEKTLEGISGEDVDRGNLNFGDVTEGLLGQQFMVDHPNIYAGLSTAGDILYDPLNLPIFKLAKGMAGSLPYLGKQMRKANIIDPALTQDITRRTKGYEQNHPRSVTIGDNQITIPPWYGNKVSDLKPDGTAVTRELSPKVAALGKPLHLLNSVVRTAQDFGEMAINPKSAALFAKFGIGPANARELGRIVKALNDPKATKVHYDLLGLKSTATKIPVNKNALMNELHSQLAYQSSIFRKFEPNDKRREAFEKSLGPYIFPKQRVGSVTEMKNNPTMIREVLELPEEIGDDIILAHIANRIPKGFGKELVGDVALNSKPYQNSAALAASYGNVKVKAYKDFTEVLREFSGSDIPIDLISIRKAAKDYFGKSSLSKPKQAERIENLMSSLKDSGGYISIQGSRLIEDRLLAHVNQIMLVKKGRKFPKQFLDNRVKGDPNHEGFVVMYDQMKQGSGSEGLEGFLDLGSKNNFIAMDTVPFRIGKKKKPNDKGVLKGKLHYGDKKGSASPVINQTPDPSSEILSPQRVEDLTEMTEGLINYKPTIREYGSQIQDRAADISLLSKGGVLDDEDRDRSGMLWEAFTP